MSCQTVGRRVSDRNQRKDGRHGMVLFIVAVVTALVSLSALGFLVSMKAENRAAHLQADQTQVEQVAQSAAAYLLQLASAAQSDLRSWGGLTGNRALFQDVTVDWDALGQRHGRFSILSPTYGEDRASAVYEFGPSSTSRKLNLRTLLVWDQQSPGQARLALLNLPGMTESVADCILDWIDADDEPREFGAESEFYQGLSPPRQPPNAIPQHIDQLLAVRGVTTWQLLGDPSGWQRVAGAGGTDQGDASARSGDAMEVNGDRPQASAGGAATAGPTSGVPWSHYLTVASGERNESFGGAKKIDLNQRDLRQLHSQLLQVVDKATADFVIAIRQNGPAKSEFDAAQRGPIPTVSLTGEASYEFDSPVDLIDMVASIKSSQRDEPPQHYRSPFAAREPRTLAGLVPFLDRVTTERHAVIDGRINIMQAPRPVLLGLPNMSAELADRLITARAERGGSVTGFGPAGQTDDRGARIHSVWLLSEGIVDVSTMKRWLPYVTVGGNILEAEIVGYYDATSPWSRKTGMLDGTVRPSRVLFFRDMSRLGHGFRYQDLALPTSSNGTSELSAIPKGGIE